MLGNEKVSKTFSTTEVQAYVAAFGTVPEEVSEYSRMILNSSMYHSESYKRAGKTDNTVVKVSAGDEISEFVKIQKFVVFTVNGDLHCYMLCRELLAPVQAEPANFMPHHIKELCLVPVEHSILIPVDKIECICAFVDIDTIKYVCDIPNFFEKD